MDARHEDCFVVFLRRDRSHADWRECEEEEVDGYPSYAEALRVKREYDASGCECVIRFVGPTGGGD